MGGPLETLTEAIRSLDALSATLSAEDAPGYLGYRYDRAGTPCALIVTDIWGQPVADAKVEEDEVCQ